MPFISKSSQKGFTLVELSIVLMILGLITGSVFAFMKQDRQQRDYRTTIDRQHHIAAMMTEYAQRVGQLPCPADPDPIGSDPLGKARSTPCTSSADRTGIVPFRDLGLDQEDAIDGYGNPFTYVVSEAAARVPDQSRVHGSCRVDTVWVDTGFNINPTKAAFCCQDAAGDVLTIERIIPGPTLTTEPIIDNQSVGDYNLVNTPFVGPLDPDDDVAYVAYALISHGANGAGAWILNPEATPRNSLDGAGDHEEENADDDDELRVGATYRQSGNDHFDDIVFWRTQQRTINGLNNDSCARP